MIRIPCLLSVVLAGVLLVGPVQVRGQDSVLDLVPADAAIVVSLKSFATIGPKVDKIAADTQAGGGGFAPSQFMQLGLLGYFNITKGFDEKGQLAVVVPNFEKAGIRGEPDPNIIVAVIPFTSAEDMAANFNLKPGALREKVVRSGDRFYSIKGNHIFVGQDEKCVAAAIAGASVWSTLTAGQKAAAVKNDLYLQTNLVGYGDALTNMLKMAESQLGEQAPVAQVEQLKKLLDLAKSIRFASAGVSLNNGVALSLRVSPKPQGVLAELLGKASRLSSKLDGLPAVSPLLALSQVNSEAITDLGDVRKSLKDALGSSPELREVLSEADEKKLVDAIEVLSKEIKSQRMVVYQPTDGEKVGIYAAMTILDVDDVEKAVEQIPTIVGVLNGMLGKAAANGPIPPVKLIYTKNADSVGGSRVDTLKVSLPDEVREMAGPAARPFLGEQWETFHIGVQGKSLVTMLGSDREAFKATMANVRTGAKGLADTKAIRNAAAAQIASRGAEFHFSFKTFAALAGSIQQGQFTARAPAVESLSSVILSADADGAELLVIVPTDEMKSLKELVEKVRGLAGEVPLFNILAK